MAGSGTLRESLTAMSLADANSLANEQHQSMKTNLPLPRELRDKIWEYLLYHQHVHTPPYPELSGNKKGEESEKCSRSISRAHTFKFYTNILAVNHQIYEECLKVLKSNDFIVVIYERPYSGVTKHISSLPVVTEHVADCAHFKHHVLSVQFRGAAHAVKEEGDVFQKGSFVMVAADLPRFCRTLQGVLYHIPGLARYAYGGPTLHGLGFIEFSALAPGVNMDMKAYLQTTIRFQDKSISGDKAKKLLSAFQSVIHPNLHVSICNCPKAIKQDISLLKTVMAPKVVWFKAMAWNILEHCQWRLAEAKLSAEHGNLGHAAENFSIIVDIATIPALFSVPSDEVYTSDAAIPLGLLSMAILDAGLTEFNIRMRLGGSHATRMGMVSLILRAMSSFLVKRPRHIREVVMSMLGFEMGPLPPPPVLRTTIFEWMMTVTEDNLAQTLVQFKDVSAVLEGDTYFDHDYALLKDLSEDKDFRSQVFSPDGPTTLLIAMCSATQLPVKVYSNPLFDAVKQPDGFEGFIDVAHRAEMQKKYPGQYNDL